MRWPRVAAVVVARVWARSAASLLIATTHVMDAGTVAVHDVTGCCRSVITFARDAITTATGTMIVTTGEGIATTDFVTETGNTRPLPSQTLTRLTPSKPIRIMATRSMRMWRNWQTRRSQKPVMVTSWRFKSSHPHQRDEFQSGESTNKDRKSTRL